MVVAVVLLIVQVAGQTPSSSPPAQPAASASRSDPASSISGTIHDLSGSVVPGATVAVRNGSKDQQTLSGPDGRFTLTTPASAEVVIIVRAAGFAELRHTISAGSARTNLDLVVTPASVQEAVTVTATRSEQRTGDVPASVSMLDRQDI